MKKTVILILCVLFSFCLISCEAEHENSDASAELSSEEYRLIIHEGSNVNVLNQPKSSYREGEIVNIRLGSISDSYYRVYVNNETAGTTGLVGDEYFTFTMPPKDVVVRIEFVSVSPPVAYAVTVKDDYKTENRVAGMYEKGDDVLIKLKNSENGSFQVSINGKMLEQHITDENFTYFVFSMPEENVTVAINEVYVNPPEA